MGAGDGSGPSERSGAGEAGAQLFHARLLKPARENQLFETVLRAVSADGPVAVGDAAADQVRKNASQQLYEKTVSVPNNLNTLTVTVTGTADDHSGAVQTLTCHIDGNDCSPSADIRIINVGENDWHDNSVVARWCMPVSSSAAPGATDHDLTIDQSSNNEGDVFIEQVLITVDGDTSGTCTDEGFTGGGDAPSHQHR